MCDKVLRPQSMSDNLCESCVAHSEEETFYQKYNGWWLNDVKEKIPAEYASWGSFTQLHDQSLKNQVSLCKELAKEACELNSEKAKIKMVWNARMYILEQWDKEKSNQQADKNSYNPIRDKLIHLETLKTENTANPINWPEQLGKYFGECMRLDIKTPFSFSSGANLSNSENIVLNLCAVSGSNSSCSRSSTHVDSTLMKTSFCTP